METNQLAEWRVAERIDSPKTVRRRNTELSYGSEFV